MKKMSDAQIAKATFDHLKHDGGMIPEHGLSDKQIWRVGYIYADVLKHYHGAPTWEQFYAIRFEGLPEAFERFDHDREMWLASRQSW